MPRFSPGLKSFEPSALVVKNNKTMIIQACSKKDKKSEISYYKSIVIWTAVARAKGGLQLAFNLCLLYIVNLM